MHRKKLIERDTNGVCFNEFEHISASHPPVLAATHMDVTSRNDGPFLGKVYDPNTDTFSLPPPTAALTASEESITRGESVKLTWETAHAVSAEIDHDVGAVTPAGGSVDVTPLETKTYTLAATGAEGTTPATAQVTVRVTKPTE